MILLADDKGLLHETRLAISDKLNAEHLLLHKKKWQVTPVRCGVDVLGYHVWPHKRRIRRDNAVRFSRRYREQARRYTRGELQLEEIRASLMSWIGHARHGDTLALRRALISPVSFVRGVEQ